MPTFNFDEAINPISAYRSELLDDQDMLPDDDELEDFEMPEEIDAVLADEPLVTDETTSAIDLYWAPEPFGKRSGKTRRSYDIPLVSHWFRERCPQGSAVKVRGKIMANSFRGLWNSGFQNLQALTSETQQG